MNSISPADNDPKKKREAMAADAKAVMKKIFKEQSPPGEDYAEKLIDIQLGLSARHTSEFVLLCKSGIPANIFKECKIEPYDTDMGGDFTKVRKSPELNMYFVTEATLKKVIQHGLEKDGGTSPGR